MNLALLCPPCNKLKRDWLALKDLQARNRQEGHMADPARIRRLTR